MSEANSKSKGPKNGNSKRSKDKRMPEEGWFYKMNPLVSLIIPLYDAESYCFRMMDSLLAQTYNSIQLILVNDGSKDSTESIVCSYRERLENKGFLFEYVYQKNKGVGGAINTGLKRVKGDFLCWADQDDFFEPDAFKIRIDYMIEHPECMALTCNAYYMDISDLDKKWEVGNSKYADDPKQFWHLLNYESAFCPGCHMLRVSAFKEVNPAMDIYEDLRGQNWQLLLPIYHRFDRVHLPIPIYNYIIHDGSVSHWEKTYEDLIKWYDDNCNLIIETVHRMRISEEEKEKIIQSSVSFHNHIKLNLSIKYNRSEDFLLFYASVKEKKELTIKEFIKCVQYKVKNHLL